jgi:hypothetical protein
MLGGRVPGAEAPCFSAAGDARTEVRAYLRSKSKDGESVLRGCGGAVDSWSGARGGRNCTYDSSDKACCFAGGSVRFDWLISFALGFGACAVLMGSLQKRMDRLRWKTLRTAIDAGVSIEQYARDLEAC